VRELRWIGEIKKKKKKKKKKERKKEDGLEIGGSNHKLACSKIYSCYPKFS
jgi:hypothetical protein